MIGRYYFVSQTRMLIQHAQLTTNPRHAAMLIEKAADLKMLVDELSARPDPSSNGPLVEARLRNLNS